MKINSFTIRFRKDLDVYKKAKKNLTKEKFKNALPTLTLKNIPIQLIINNYSLHCIAKEVLDSFSLPYINDLAKKDFFVFIDYLRKEELSLFEQLKDHIYYPWEGDIKEAIIFYYCEFLGFNYFILLVDISEDKMLVFLSPKLYEANNLYQQFIFQIIILTSLSIKNYFPLHTALLTYRNYQGILLTGPSGCGKSTLAEGLKRSGLQCITDDLCFLYKYNGEIYSTFCYLKDAVNLLPQYKVGYFIPKILIFPEICSLKKSELIAINSFEAFDRLSNSFPIYIMYDKYIISFYFYILRSLISQSRIFLLRSGRDIKQKPSLIYHLINKELN